MKVAVKPEYISSSAVDVLPNSHLISGSCSYRFSILSPPDLVAVEHFVQDVYDNVSHRGVSAQDPSQYVVHAHCSLTTVHTVCTPRSGMCKATPASLVVV